MRITIYSLNDPTTGECMYVGATKRLSARLREHFCHSSCITSTRSWIEGLGQKPEWRVLDVVDHEVASDDELFYIELLKPALNSDRQRGYHHTPELCDRLSAVALQYYENGVL